MYARHELLSNPLRKEEYQQLGCDDAQEHRKRINRSVTYSRCIIACRRVRISQGRGVCRTSGNHTHEGEIIDLAELTRDKPDDEQRQEGNDEAIANPRITTVYDCIDEPVAGAQTYAGEEHGDTDLAQHEVGALRRIGDELVMVSEAADEDGYDERTTCQTELQRLRNTWNPDRKASEDDT